MTLTRSWDDLVAWLRAEAPVSAAMIGPPAAPDELARAQARYALPWPADLVTLFGLSNGSRPEGEDAGAQPFPLMDLIDLERSWREQRINREVDQDFAGTWARDEIPDPDTQGADDLDVPRWSSHFVPFAGDDSGDCLFVDLRPGRFHGGVGRWLHADNSWIRWPSLPALFAELTTAVTTGREFDGWTAQVVDGRLDWTPARG